MIPKQLCELEGVQEYTRSTGYIYFLVRNGRVVYVGQTLTLGSRINTHSASAKKFDQVFYVEVGFDDLNETEARWIKRLSPQYNTSPGTTTKKRKLTKHLVGGGSGRRYAKLPIWAE